MFEGSYLILQGATQDGFCWKISKGRRLGWGLVLVLFAEQGGDER